MTREQLIENFATSLEQERNTLGYSQTEMAQALDISLSTYKRIINGETNKLDFYTVYQAFCVTGKFAFELCRYEDTLLQTVGALRRLNQSQLRTINSFIEFEDSFTQSLSSNYSPEDYTTLIIPSGCMQDGMIYDSCSLGKINIAAYRKRYHDTIDCAILVTTNHLNPVYNINDILLVDKSPIQDGDTGIFLNKESGLAYIRRFRRDAICRLEPLCAYGRTIYVNSNDASDTSKWIKFGRVITKMRTDTDASNTHSPN